MFYCGLRPALDYGIITAGHTFEDYAVPQSHPIAIPASLCPTIPPGPARTPATGLLLQGNRLEADDEVRPTAVRLPPRSLQTPRPILRMDLQGQWQDRQCEAQPASSPALS